MQWFLSASIAFFVSSHSGLTDWLRDCLFALLCGWWLSSCLSYSKELVGHAFLLLAPCLSTCIFTNYYSCLTTHSLAYPFIFLLSCSLTHPTPYHLTFFFFFYFFTHSSFTNSYTLVHELAATDLFKQCQKETTNTQISPFLHHLFLESKFSGFPPKIQPHCVKCHLALL